MSRLVSFSILTSLLLLTSCASVTAKKSSETPPVTPRWAYEPWVWEDNSNTQKTVLELIDGYRSRSIPVGAIIIDSPWSTGYNNFLWDTARYPDPKGMIKQLHQQGVRVVMWMTGNINSKSLPEIPLSKSSNYDLAVAKGYGLVSPTDFSWWKGSGIFVDVTNPDAKKWFASEIDKVMNMGIDGFKCDEGVAYLPDQIMTSTGPMSVDDYKLLWYDYMADYTTGRNPAAIIVARPYSHQHGIHTRISKCIMGWCGDFDGDYKGLRFQMENLYRSAQMGYSVLQVEVGGFWKQTSNKNQLIRYVQFGAMMPSMNNGGSNGGLTNHLPWWQDEQAGGGTETTDIYRYFATLHSELVPFLFSLGVEANLTGRPIVRQADIEKGQHTLGDDILVGIMDSDHQKTVYPPKGQWIDFWDRDRLIAGDKTLELNLPLDRYPIYIRNGAIIPMHVQSDITGHGDSASASKTTLLIFPSGTQQTTFYRPIGEGVEYSPVQIAVNTAKGTIQLTSQTSHDWILRVQVANRPESVKGADKWSYDETAKVIIIHKSAKEFLVTIKDLGSICLSAIQSS